MTRFLPIPYFVDEVGAKRHPFLLETRAKDAKRTLTYLPSPAFTSYGAFWMSYAIILWPSSGVLTAFEDPTELSSALGIFLITWSVVTFLLL